MSGPARKTRLALGLTLGAWSLPVPAAETPAAPTATVQLPPMMVEESISSTPWLYVDAGGTEFLSRCSITTTRSCAEAWLSKLQLVRALVPEEFLSRMDVPSVFVLYAQDLKQTVSAEIQRELQAADKGDDRGGDASGSGRVGIAPSMRLSDRDMHASIAYIDEALFDAATLSVASNHVRYLLEGRVPELPTWLIDGVEATYRAADFVREPITLRPLIWIDQGESDALARDAHYPRALLPAPELFATGIVRAAENQHPRRQAIRAAEEELLVRWAILAGGTMREAFWKFAARAAEGPVTDEQFEALFGFDFATLRDRLSDFLPRAVRETTWIDPGTPPTMPRIKVERATPNEVARVRGEWERLAIGHVQRSLPQVRAPYIAQARRTLRRAYDAGDRDPRLLATMGLCEVDAGNEPGALEFLEPATTAGVVRPRAYYELARIRFAQLQQGKPTTAVFSFTELAPIFAPLRHASTQAPALPEIYELWAEAWARCTLAPNASEMAELKAGARLFAQRPTVAYLTALALSRHGRISEAAAVLDACAGEVTDEATRIRIALLRNEWKAAPAPVQP